jgi:glycosyltransferase involved in cell wall biosynthesis
MKLLYYSPATYGGMAEYGYEQASALTAAGVEVTVLTTPLYRSDRGGLYTILSSLRDPPARGGKPAFAMTLLSNFAALARRIRNGGFSHVLFGSYVEYLAPFWSPPLRRLARAGTVFGSVVHDPVRDFVLGPSWWHRWSVACGYSFLRQAFVHEDVRLDTVRPMPRLTTTVIPQGIYSSPAPSGRNLRAELNIPNHAHVMLSFGHIRDGKNLHLALRAMAGYPDVYLVIAGDVQSSGQKPVAYYRTVAEEAGVAKRCRWLNRYIDPAEVGDLFELADIVLLTYSAKFRSASAVLNTAACYRKPCIASSGPGNLRTVVLGYGLGIWVEPDDEAALAAGLRNWIEHPPEPRWDDYFAANSWQRNAEIVIRQMWEQR